MIFTEMCSQVLLITTSYHVNSKDIANKYRTFSYALTVYTNTLTHSIPPET